MNRREALKAGAIGVAAAAAMPMLPMPDFRSGPFTLRFHGEDLSIEDLFEVEVSVEQVSEFLCRAPRVTLDRMGVETRVLRIEAIFPDREPDVLWEKPQL